MSKKMRALIVDDDVLNVESIKEDLQDSNFEVVTAFNGKEALKILNSDNDFRVVLLDRMMPEMDGMEVLKIMKNDPHLKYIPVIIQSAVTDVKEMVKGYDEGCYHYITKPFSKNAMMIIVDIAIEKARKEAIIREVYGEKSKNEKLLEQFSDSKNHK